MEIQMSALQYIKNTKGCATREDFMEEYDPNGQMLWKLLVGMFMVDKNGRLWLTNSGAALLTLIESE